MFKQILLLSVLSLGATAALAEDIPTRFGPLTITDDNTLTFKGRPVPMPVAAEGSLSSEKTYQVGNDQVVLIGDSVGTACPSTYLFVTVSATGARVTPKFGTCSDLIKVTQAGSTLTATMPGYVGDSEPAKAQRKAAKERHVYVFQNGTVTETKARH